ncbi:MAG: hypothetical protein QMD21_01060 [Candidatus Thermoplasmatota archaeon]|nr:hypothetical protein [Candidatus Thermoplasmatota archaeon]MDI6887399.1 hypothetical protein [Candidatus Thermoplasmatota archaeon]
MVKGKGIIERAKAGLRAHPVAISKKVDIYLSERLPELMDEYKLATKRDLEDIDKRFVGYETEISEIDSWKSETIKRVDNIEKRVERAEIKYGVKG